jgi:hypothetical protein
VLTYLKLTNFKRHEDLEIHFTGGLQLIRAANEAGKSSLLNAVAYALYGARALPMSLADTVTYGKPEASLRVLLRFSFNGANFEIERHKNGAELRGDGVTASGQAEVTAFVDRLFNCSAAVATSLMFANQGELRGALEGGQGAAVSLIEKLADVDALDRLVTKAQTELPSGNTKLLESRIAELQALEKPVADFQHLEDEALDAALAVAAADDTVRSLEREAATLDTQALQAQIAAAQHARKALSDGQALHARLLPLANAVTPPWPNVAELRALEAEQVNKLILAGQYAKFLRVQQTQEPAWVSEAAMREAEAELRASDTAERLRTQERSLTQAEMAIIKEDLCGFCGKSFADVPEVIAKNTECAALAALAKENIAELTARHQRELARLSEIRATERLANQSALAVAGLPVEAFGGYPPKYKWVGGSVPDVSTIHDYKAEIERAEHAITTFQRIEAQAAEAREQLKTLDLGVLTKEAGFTALAARDAEALLAEHQVLQQRLNAARTALQQATQVLHDAQQKLSTAKVEFAAAQKAYEQNQASLTQVRADLSTYILNNKVIKKIRDARPLVAKQLWAVVLGTVSHYFSQMRGTPSVVTREGAEFLVDGKPAKGLSGSTLDALGLAIRIALTRTFLPNVPWLVLDEPAAAADNDREAAMLGVVSSCGFPQVIMVSHSDVGDSYAANVITF